ncbi:hypothetical protein GCM10009001_04250 [Virgibacillus siamensis]|uniref:Intracellular proteinase inhibitor BsuPI domain-containing protein n=1 Tax=Virgibacillus siamensis TaxID=480071 RepID=A0ABN1FI82_9BACI
MLRISLLLILIIGLISCSQQGEKPKVDEQTDPNSEQSSGSSGGIVAGSLETSLQIKDDHALFRVKNQTEQVKELHLKSEDAFEYIIRNGGGEVVFEQSQNKGETVVLKQAEELKYKIPLPGDLQDGTYELTAILHGNPELEEVTSFSVGE